MEENKRIARFFLVCLLFLFFVISIYPEEARISMLAGEANRSVQGESGQEAKEWEEKPREEGRQDSVEEKEALPKPVAVVYGSSTAYGKVHWERIRERAEELSFNPYTALEVPQGLEYVSAYARLIVEIERERQNLEGTEEEKEEKTWQNSYTYELIHIDNDGVPELSLGQRGYWVSVYSWKNGQLTTLLEERGYGAAGVPGYEYLPYENVIYVINNDYAGAERYTTYGRMDRNGQWETIRELKYINHASLQQNTSPYHTYDQEEEFFLLHAGDDDEKLSEKEYASYHIEGDYQPVEGGLYRDKFASDILDELYEPVLESLGESVKGSAPLIRENAAFPYGESSLLELAEGHNYEYYYLDSSAERIIWDEDAEAQINLVKHYREGSLYRLEIKDWIFEINEPERFNIYLYVTADKIYRLFPEICADGRLLEITGKERVIRGKLDTDEKLIQNSRLIYQKEEMTSSPVTGQSGCYSTIVHEGETTTSHSFSLNHLGETEYWETFIWEEGKGLTGYRSGYGEKPGEEELYLKNIRLVSDEKEQTKQVITYEKKVYQSQGELHDIRICYPQITGMENQEKQKRINRLLKEELFKACLPNSLEDSNLILEMDYRVTYVSEKMISICYRGRSGRVVHSGAGGLWDWLCLSVNVDLKTERVMELSDLGIDQDRLVDLLLEGQYENLKSWDGILDQNPINRVYEENTEETRRRLKGSLNKEDKFNPMDWYVDKTGFILIARFIYADYYELYLTWDALLGEAVDGPVSIRLNNPKGQGWNMEEIVDVREDQDTLYRYVYEQDEELKQDTCLIGVTDNYRLYGKGDCRSMLLEQGGEYIRLDYAYTSNYMYLPGLWEKDMDGDGFSELAICLHTLHGTGISIEFLLLADRDEQGDLLVYEFEAKDYLPLLQRHISWEIDETGIQPEVDEKAAGPFVEHPKEREPYRYVTVGDQIAFWDTEEGIQICAELMLMRDEYIIPYYNGTDITATVVWEKNSRFSLKDFGIWKED